MELASPLSLVGSSTFAVKEMSDRGGISSLPAPLSSSARLSLLWAISSQASFQARRNVQNFTSEALRYISPRRTEATNLEESLMTVPDLETIPFRVLRRENGYEVREVQSYVVAETIMPGARGFDFYGSSQGFNTLAAYLFGKNTQRKEMEMTTPVLTSRVQSEGEKMDMTTPVITQKTDGGRWKMAFVIPSKYGDNAPLPNEKAVSIKRVQPKVVAVTAFSGYVTDDIVKVKEQALRKLLERDRKLQVKPSTQAEVSQFNPPFTLPFMRRNEISIEVVQIDSTK